MRAFIELLVFCFLLSGCITNYTDPRPVKQKMEEIKPKVFLEKEKEIKKPGPPPFSEKLEPFTKDVKKESQLYSLVFDKAPFGEIIRAITKDMDVNLSVEPDIDLNKPITVNLKNVTFEEALNLVVVKGAGYSWKIEKSILFLKKFEERIYNFNYLDLAIGTDIEVGGDMLASSVQGSGVKGSFSVKGKKDSKEVDVWANIEDTLKSFKSADGILRINRNVGMIYIADTPSKISTMVRYLDALSENLVRQIFIEAKILEVKLNDKFKLGIDWTKGVTIDFILKSEKAKEILPDALGIGLGFGGAITLGTKSKFNAILDFLKTQGDVSVLSNPHITVMNGQTSMMTVGYQFPYGDVAGATVSDQGTVTFNSSIKRAVIGLQLGITPQISDSGIIALHIVPTVTRIDGRETVDIPITGSASQSITNPIIGLQELSTMVRVRESHSVILAGLISTSRSIEHNNLPFLSNLPFIKNMFKHINEEKENRELVIIITPYIKEAL
ncbi:MAG: hypothetical protein HQK79_17505 [Desulfobacterales bacterium]|nr:hypothetical protein [Desulfobacterales bacterium]